MVQFLLNPLILLPWIGGICTKSCTELFESDVTNSGLTKSAQVHLFPDNSIAFNSKLVGKNGCHGTPRAVTGDVKLGDSFLQETM